MKEKLYEKLINKYLAHAVMEDYIKLSLKKMHIKMDSFISESDLIGGEEKKLNDIVIKLYEKKTRPTE
jgi:hypothetical protein